jgi:hypothetical protein
MAGLGWKAFTTETLSSAEVQGYLMDQAVMKFASTAERGTVLSSPSDGMVTYCEDIDRLDHREGTHWRPVDGFWGTYAIAATWPADARTGDRLYCTEAKCAYTYVGGAWYQSSISAFTDFAAIETFRAAVDSAGGGVIDRLHNGFQAFDSSKNTLWVAQGGSGSTSIWQFAAGSSMGTVVTEVTATAAGFTTSSGFSVTTLYARRIGNMGYLDAVVTRTGAAITVPADGNVANTQVFTVPTALRPALNVPMLSGATGPMTVGALTSAGAVNLQSIAPGASLATSATFQLGAMFYPLADPTASYLAASPFA